MAGHGEKLGRKAEAAIAALLAEPTVEAAAAKAAVSYASLKAWLKRPAFAAAYAAARKEVLAGTVNLLTKYSAAAVTVLAKNLVAEKAADQIRAACAILDHCFRAVELQDLAERVQLLEERARAEGKA
jgi:hypothetical protein